MSSHQSGLIVRVHPRAKQDAVEVTSDGTVRVQVTAAPERGKANVAVVRLLAKRLGVRRSSVSILRGRTGRVKTIQIEDMGPSEVVRRLRD